MVGMNKTIKYYFSDERHCELKSGVGNSSRQYNAFL